MIRHVALLGVLVLSARSVLGGDDYAPREGWYSVRFPGKPRETTQAAKTADGELGVAIATFATEEGNVLMVSYTDFPAGRVSADTRKSIFDSARDGLKGQDGKVRFEKGVEVGTGRLPARDIEIEKGKQRLRFRLVLRGNRLYQVAAIGTSAFTGGKQAAAFLESFQVTR